MRKWLSLLGIALTAVSLAACGTHQAAKSAHVSVESSQPTKYRRVVVSTGTIAQYLSALHVPMVGVPQEDNVPASLKKLPTIGQPRHVNLEKVVSLHPDLFVGDAAMANMTQQALAKQKIKTTYLDNMSYDKVMANIERLGKMFGRQARAQAIVKRMRQNEGKAVAGAVKLKGKKVVILFGTGENFMVATKNSYLGSLLGKLGVHNIADDLVHAPTPYMPISMESVVARNPDYILTLAHGNKQAATAAFKQEMAKPIWQTTAARQQNHVYALADQTFPVTGNIHADTTLTNLKDLLLYGPQQ